MTKITYKFEAPYRNKDEQTISNNLFSLQDCYLDEAGSIRKKPGLSDFCNFGTEASIDGIFWWDFYDCYIVVSGGNVYKIIDTAGGFSQIGSGIMEPKNRVTFAEVYDITNSELRLFFANGGSIYYTDGATCTEVTGASAPSKCTHVASIDTYLLCNDLDFPFFWRASAVENPTVINQAYSAQYSTDKINGVYVYNKRIYVTGRKSIELYYNSGDTVPFKPINGAVVDKGTPSSYGFMAQDFAFYFSSIRDINILNGYSPVSISDGYAKRIQEFTYVNDVEVDYINGLNGRKFLLVHFNDAGVTLAYDILSKSFSEWGKWNGASYDQYIGRCYAYSNSWNISIIGDRSTGKVYKMSESYTKDGSETIRCEIVTANYNHGTFKNKQSNSLFIDTRKGDGLSSDANTSGSLFMQFRDNKSLIWSNDVEISLGAVGDTMLNRTLQSMGSYQTRQYKFVMQDDCKFVLNGMEEDVDSKST